MKYFKKIGDIFKYKYMFLLFVIPFIFVSFGNKSPNGDMWFIIALGRYVSGNGVPNVDPFTLHEGLSYIMQQWGSAFIMSSIYDIFGKYGLLIMVYVVFILLLILFYKLCKQCNKSDLVSIILTTFAISIIGKFFVVTRPHIFSYLIFLIELIILEKYTNTCNWKYLIGLPLLSILLVNLHLSMWYFLFVFMLPFIVNAIYIKGFTIDKIKFKPLLIAMVCMFFVGIINPYGIGGLSFIFKSYGLDLINEKLVEMQAPSLNDTFGLLFFIAMLLIFFLIFCQRYVKNFKLDIRHICFIFGTYFLYLNHLKCFPYFILIYFYVLAYGFSNIKSFNLKFKYFNQIKNIFTRIFSICCVFLIFTFFLVIYLTVKNYSFEPLYSFNSDEVEIADFIEKNYGVDGVRLYNSYNEGPYYLYRGFKVYVDGRAELFFKSHNGKADILEEAISVESDTLDFDYKSFVDKYKFTHLIILEGSNFKKYMDTDTRYEIVYTSYFDEQQGFPYRYIYSLVEEGNNEKK